MQISFNSEHDESTVSRRQMNYTNSWRKHNIKICLPLSIEGIHDMVHWASSLSFTGCLCNFVFNTNWLFWLSVISRVLFLHICPLFCIFINLRVFFAHLLKNCSKFPGLTLSQPVNAHFILLPRLFGTRFQAVFVTTLISCNSSLIWKPICSVKLFLIHSSCVFFLFFVRPEFFGRFCAL